MLSQLCEGYCPFRKLKGRGVRAYLEDIFSENILRRTLGIAALNALSTLVWEKTEHSGYELLLGADAFDEIDVKKYRKTVVVGALVPIIRKLMQENADFTFWKRTAEP